MQVPEHLPSGWVVYLIENTINRMVYVGMSGDLKTRIRSHLSKVKRGGSYLHSAMRKTGVQHFRLQILAQWPDAIEASRSEQIWIAFIGSQTHGYNLTSGGEGVSNLSADSMSKLRASLSKALRGKPKSDRHRAAMSACRIGVKRPPSVAVAMRAFRTGRKASDEQRAQMSVSRKGRAVHENTLAALQHSRTDWKATSEQRKTMSKAARKCRGRGVQCIEKNKTFETILDASAWLRTTGFPSASPSPIGRVCRGTQNTAYGMTWRFVDEICADSAEDGVAYAGLKAEAKAKE